MNPAEYDRMYALENRYWWFVARRRLAMGLLTDFGLRISDCGYSDEIVTTRSRESPNWPDPAQSDLSLIDTSTSDNDQNPQSPIGNPQSAIRNPKSIRVLDLGCGTGAVLEELAHFGSYVGLDMSGQALEYCRQRGLTRLAIGKGEALPFSTGSFDAIVALDVFEHIENDQAAMNEALRVLKPGGILVLSVPAFKALWGPHDVALMHFRRYRSPELRAKLRSAGFQIELLSYSVFFLFPLVVLIRFFERRKPNAEASLPAVPEWLNRALVKLQNLEAKLLRRVTLPWGSSLIAVGRKPS
ncbi:MAG: class I SAM-dependent methyltransferase [Armatimonadetes bacterium]|nr:class I SAM-dependent methyltransferase [Armatimonadota bacterium]